MNTKNLPTWILILTLLAIPSRGLTQKIDHVVSEVSGNTIHIFYDLSDLAADQAVIIRIFLSTDGGISYGESLKNVVGDVGVVIGPGNSKQIIWDVFAEVDELVSESVKFRVRADLLRSEQNERLFNPGYMAGLKANLGSKVKMSSYGFDFKAGILLKKYTLGIRGDYYLTKESGLADQGHYMGFSGGLFAEYDLIRNPSYSLYPYGSIGQTKIEYIDGPDTKYVGYSIYYTPGLGFGIHLAKFLFLGIEIEYMMAPVIDMDDQAGSDWTDQIILDGFSAGVTLKIIKPAPEK